MRWKGLLCVCCLLSCFWLAPQNARGADVAGVLKEITSAAAVGGKGPAAAKAASDKLVKLGPQAIAETVLALEGTDIVARNWALSALHQIVNKEIADGGKHLPAKKLSAILANDSQSARTRRLALTILAKADPAGTAARVFAAVKQTQNPSFRAVLLRILARMNDPQVVPTLLSFARGEDARVASDALTALLAVGDYALERGLNEDAQMAYRYVFDLGRTANHVSTAAKKLRSIGLEAKVSDRFEFLLDWYVLGPFASNGKDGFKKVYPPEQGVDLRASYEGKGKSITWRSVRAQDDFGMMDFTRIIRRKIQNAVVYCFTAFESPREADVQLLGGCDDSMVVWLNGQRVISTEKWLGAVVMDEQKGRGHVRQGRNEILVKICQGPNDPRWTTNGWGFQLRVADLKGKSLGIGESLSIPIAASLDDPTLPARLAEVAAGGDPRDAGAAGNALLKLGDRAEDHADREAARKLYQLAFDTAPNQGIMRSAIGKLHHVGIDVNVAKQMAFVTKWMVIGPFDSPKKEGFRKVYSPERAIVFKDWYNGKDGKRVGWHKGRSYDEFGVFDFRKDLGEVDDAVGYAYTMIFTKKAMDAEVRVGSDDTVTVWVNKEKVLNEEKWEGGVVMDQFRAPVRLKRGRNRILVKICQGPENPQWENGWGFQFRLVDAEGKPLKLSAFPRM